MNIEEISFRRTIERDIIRKSLEGKTSCFRPTRIYKGAIPDHGEQAHALASPRLSEKPKVVTNRIHLSKDGRNLNLSQGSSLPLSINSSFIDSIRRLVDHRTMNHLVEPIHGLSSKWVEQLALEELNMDESGIVHMDNHLNPAALLEESSIDYMNAIRDRFEFYITRFNEFRGGANTGALIKTFKISNTVNDFMLFRNSLRMIFARRAHDVISIGFLANGKDIFAPRLSENDHFGQAGAHEIRAHIGPFNEISWRFQGEVVDIDSLVRHYLSEFIRQSAR